MNRVLVAGCGDIGGALALRLLASGHDVHALRRNVSRLPAGPKPIAADLLDPGSLDAVPSGIGVLCYTAAADRYEDAAYLDAYVRGVQNLLAAMDRSRLQRVVFVSSTSVYGQNDGSWVDERSVTHPSGFAGRRVLQGERAAAESGVVTTAVRFGGIYGPGRNRMLTKVRNAGACSPTLWTNRIHRDDCAGVLAHLVDLANPPPLCVAVDCEPALQCEVMDWLAPRMGVPRPPRAGGGSTRGGNKRCSSRALRESGYSFRYPSYREGYAAMIECGVSARAGHGRG